jgi:hypothetical protein
MMGGTQNNQNDFNSSSQNPRNYQNYAYGRMKREKGNSKSENPFPWGHPSYNS